MFNRYLTLILLLGLSTVPVYAEKYHFDGGGGFSLGIHNPDLGFLDDALKQNTPGFKKVEGPLYYWGGFGYGEVADNIRIGGYGFGGGATISGTLLNASGKPHPAGRDHRDWWGWVSVGIYRL